MVTSAINTPYSSVSPQQRFQQTLDTIHSIHRHCADCYVIVVEVGPNALDPVQYADLLKVTTAVMSLNDDSNVKLFHHCGGDQSYGWVKTPGELYALMLFLYHETFLTDTDRVFKISGRYQLTSEFDLASHSHHKKLVIARRQPAVRYINPQGQPHPIISPYQYKTRLYSFCGSLRHFMRDRYQVMYDRVIQHYQKQQFVDVEHIMFQVCHDMCPVELDVIGVGGQQSIDGVWVQE